MICSSEEFLETINKLIEAWCDRRCLSALRAILAGWPMGMPPLTDSWHELLIALQNVRAFARGETTDEEKRLLDECILAIDRMLRER
jgi:hypothetical protein